MLSWRVMMSVILLVALCGATAQTASDVELLNEQVLTLLQQGKFNEALSLGQKALKLSEDTLGPADPTTATCLNNLAGAYEKLGDYRKAEPFSERALKIREKALGPEHPFTARNLDNLANIWIGMGNYTNAEPLLERSLAINEKVLGPEDPATGRSLAGLGVLYCNIGQYPKAEPLLLRSLTVSEKGMGPEAPSTASCLNNLAALYWRMADYERAEPLFVRTLKLREKTLGAQHPATARALQALGALYSETADYEKAQDFYRRALAIQEKNPGPEHPDIAITLGGLAFVYMKMGDYSKAYPLCERAVRIHEKVLGPAHPTTARSLGKLAGLYERMNDHTKAKALHERVLDILEKVLGPESPDTALALLNLGALYEKMGDYTNANALDLRALRIQEKYFGLEHPHLAAILNNLSAVYADLKDYKQAEECLKRALSIDEKLLGPSHPSTLLEIENLGYLYYEMGKYSTAAEMAEKAARGGFNALANIFSFTSEKERLAYQASVNPYSLFVALSNGPQLSLEILRRKGVVLDSLIEDHLIAESSQKQEDQILLLEKLRQGKQRLSELVMKVPKNMNERDFKTRADDLASLSKEVETLEAVLARNVSGLGRARRGLGVTVEQVQAVLPRDSVLVEFLRYHHYHGRKNGEKRYGAVILSSTGEPKWISLGPAKVIDENVLLYQGFVRRRDNETGLKHMLKDLYGQIWSPIQAALPPGMHSVNISPDASLNFISFATLLTPEDQFLAEKYRIRYVASGRDLLHKDETTTNREMVVFANPDYLGSPGDRRSELYLAPLPNFITHAKALEANAKRWNWPVRVYLGANASEAQLRAVRSPRVLHLATHGFFLPESIRGVSLSWFMSLISGDRGGEEQVLLRNPMQRGGVALAGAQKTLNAWQRGEIPPTDNDGILTAEEVSALNLRNTWLVVLAACDTGVGELRDGEGVIGLRRGFVQAGTQNLLMTLWPVFDKSTGDFMLDFYTAVEGSGNAPEALAKVQRDWLIRLRKNQGLLPAVILGGPFVLSSQAQP